MYQLYHKSRVQINTPVDRWGSRVAISGSDRQAEQVVQDLKEWIRRCDEVMNMLLVDLLFLVVCCCLLLLVVASCCFLLLLLLLLVLLLLVVVVVLLLWWLFVEAI